MNRDPIDWLLAKLAGNNRDPWACLWNPFDPSTLFCVLLAIVAMALCCLLRTGG